MLSGGTLNSQKERKNTNPKKATAIRILIDPFQFVSINRNFVELDFENQSKSCCRALRFLLTREFQHSNTLEQQPCTLEPQLQHAHRSCLYEEDDGCDQRETEGLLSINES